ncbi:MAG: nucleoid-associated protein [Taibaiella sp.]|nr:nucleoid-associated protein [Taibaiella sp.]
MQMNFSDAVLKYVSAHYIGNKGNGQDLITSKKPFTLHADELAIITQAFFGKFNLESDKYAFSHGSSLSYNEVYNFCLESLADEGTLQANAVNLAKHLYENTTHPKVKAGELYVCYFGNCLVNGAFVDAMGMFKTENKSSFLDIDTESKDFTLNLRTGADVSRFDKACIVLPTNAEKGFDVLIYDSNGNRGDEAQFWREGFLGVVPQATEYYHTNQFMGLAKEFITAQLPQEYDIEKTGQIDLLNKSVEYFRANEAFDKKQFAADVFEDKRIIKSFKEFESSYTEMNEIELPDNFDISVQAVKKQVRVFKSVLKLDKNFHVYIHGDKSLIEKGVDEKTGKKFYKIYYDEEN